MKRKIFKFLAILICMSVFISSSGQVFAKVDEKEKTKQTVEKLKEKYGDRLKIVNKDDNDYDSFVKIDIDELESKLDEMEKATNDMINAINTGDNEEDLLSESEISPMSYDSRSFSTWFPVAGWVCWLNKTIYYQYLYGGAPHSPGCIVPNHNYYAGNYSLDVSFTGINTSGVGFRVVYGPSWTVSSTETRCKNQLSCYYTGRFTWGIDVGGVFVGYQSQDYSETLTISYP